MNKEKPEPKRRRSRGDDYVNNKDFSAAVWEYVLAAKEARDNNKEVPQISNYIAECMLKICNGLSRSANFVSYTYREDMVMDAVENCIHAINNYDISKATRTGTPNAFSYFTKISWYAFLRRIAKEKKQSKIKQDLIEKGSIGNFAEFDEDIQIGETLIERVRQRNDDFYDDLKETENCLFDDSPSPKPAAKKVPKVGPLSSFIEEDL